MFGALAKERHKRRVLSDHNRMIREAVEDTFIDQETGDIIYSSDLDAVMGDDSIVSDSELDALEELIDSVITKDSRDIKEMGEEELEECVKQVEGSNEE